MKLTKYGTVSKMIPMTSQSITHWNELTILVIRKEIKNIYLVIKPGGKIEVRAPYHMNLTKIHKFIESKSKWILTHKEMSEGKYNPIPEASTLSIETKKVMKSKLNSILAPMLSHWQKKMKTPEVAVKIRWMRTRWGSCNPWKRTVTFNLALADKSHDCIEYVVVHELAHLFERKHNDRYYKILDSFLPKHRDLRKKLNHSTSKT
jgi:predicted metal-dependent hydrolase